MAEWISVNDRLPPRFELVIVEGGVGYWWDDTNGWYTVTGFNQPGKPIQWNVTHWMPLPKLDVPAKRDAPVNCKEAGPGKGRCVKCAAGLYEKCLYVVPHQDTPQ